MLVLVATSEKLNHINYFVINIVDTGWLSTWAAAERGGEHMTLPWILCDPQTECNQLQKLLVLLQKAQSILQAMSSEDNDTHIFETEISYKLQLFVKNNFLL